MRLQKIIAMAGITSRRKAEELITSGKVTVNGAVVKELGYQADHEVDHIKVEGQLIDGLPSKVYLMLHKPRGCVTTVSDEKGRPTVMDLLGKVKGRVFPVGRLDYDAEGLLLLTNDGELAEAVAHPSHGVTKTYRVKVKGKPGEETLRKMSQGIKLKDGHRPRARVRVKKTLKRNCWLEIRVQEGQKHMVKNICRAAGLTPLRVVRTDIASLGLEGLPSGKYRHLTREEILSLREAAGLPGVKDEDRRD